MEELLRQFRGVAPDRRGRGLRYTPELHQLALQYAEKVRVAGGSREQAAEALGLSKATLCRWLHKAAAQRLPVGTVAIHAVKVVDGRDQGGPVLVMPSGVRVEGLKLGELVTVLAALR